RENRTSHIVQRYSYSGRPQRYARAKPGSSWLPSRWSQIAGMRKILLLVTVVAACGSGLEPEPICARSLVGLCGTVRFRGAVPANTENVFIAAYLMFPQTCTDLINNRRPVIPGSVPFTDSVAAYSVPLSPGTYEWVLAVWKKPGTLTLTPADTQYLRVAGYYRSPADSTQRGSVA